MKKLSGGEAALRMLKEDIDQGLAAIELATGQGAF